MKILQFKLWVLMLFISITITAQTENVYSKIFETNDNTSALIKLLGSDLEIVASPNNKFYIEYSIDFENYSNKIKKRNIEKVQIEAQIIDNHITVNDESKFLDYRLYSTLGMLNRNNTLKDSIYNQKSENLLMSEIKDAFVKKPFYIESIMKMYKDDPEQKKASINRYNKRKKRTSIKNFIIKVPSNVSLTIDAKNSIIRMNKDFENKLSVRLDGGKLVLKSIHNKESIIKVKDAEFIAEVIDGGEIILNNVHKGLIGKINNAKLNTEFSAIEIGEVQKNNSFISFNINLVIHDFSDNFEKFNLISEYSKIHYFKLNTHYSLNVNGYNTVINNMNIIEKTKKNNNGIKSSIFKIKPNTKDLLSGKMNFDVTHGFIYIH